MHKYRVTTGLESPLQDHGGAINSCGYPASPRPSGADDVPRPLVRRRLVIGKAAETEKLESVLAECQFEFLRKIIAHDALVLPLLDVAAGVDTLEIEIDPAEMPRNIERPCFCRE
jgi:hypothetical protein